MPFSFNPLLGLRYYDCLLKNAKKIFKFFPQFFADPFHALRFMLYDSLLFHCEGGYAIRFTIHFYFIVGGGICFTIHLYFIVKGDMLFDSFSFHFWGRGYAIRFIFFGGVMLFDSFLFHAGRCWQFILFFCSILSKNFSCFDFFLTENFF